MLRRACPEFIEEKHGVRALQHIPFDKFRVTSHYKQFHVRLTFLLSYFNKTCLNSAS